MNFAQLIDPEWVWDGAQERYQARRRVRGDAAKIVLARARTVARTMPDGGRVVVAPEMASPAREVLPSPIRSSEEFMLAQVHRAKRDARLAAEAAERAKRSGRVNGLKGRSHALLALLAKCPEGLRARQVRDYAEEQAPHEDGHWVYAMLSNLCNSRLLSTRVYISGAVYHITEAGRERVVPEAARWTREG